jgi:serine/threonine protein phosphatase PrpC
MTRSFGDRVAATVGTISEPEIKEFELKDEDKFILIASDGVWEFIDSQECVDIIKDYYLSNDMKGCCEHLYLESKKRWLKEEEVVDDITMILIFFE